jgi:hypothetical protein
MFTITHIDTQQLNMMDSNVESMIFRSANTGEHELYRDAMRGLIAAEITRAIVSREVFR